MCKSINYILWFCTVLFSWFSFKLILKKRLVRTLKNLVRAIPFMACSVQEKIFNYVRLEKTREKLTKCKKNTREKLTKWQKWWSASLRIISLESPFTYFPAQCALLKSLNWLLKSIYNLLSCSGSNWEMTDFFYCFKLKILLEKINVLKFVLNKKTWLRHFDWLRA